LVVVTFAVPDRNNPFTYAVVAIFVDESVAAGVGATVNGPFES